MLTEETIEIRNKQQYEQIKPIIDKYLDLIKAILVEKKGALTEDLELTCELTGCTYPDGGDGSTLVFQIWIKNLENQKLNKMAKFKLQDTPGCCGSVVYTQAEIYTPWAVFYHADISGLGIGTLLHDFALESAKKLGYSLITATSNKLTVGQNKIFTKKEWTKVETFKNGRSGCDVFVWHINI
jgi:GNAT superfamily N-acetyltransferase